MAGRVGDTQFFGKSKEKLEPPSELEKLAKRIEEIDKEYIIEKIDIPQVEKRIDGAYDRVDYVTHLWETYVIADILGYAFFGILALFFFMLAYLFKKYNIAKYIFITIGILIALNGSLFTKSIIDSVARSSKLENLEIQRFDYSDNMIVNIDLLNTGKFDYEECNVHFTFYKKTDRTPINIINRIKPLYEQSVKLKDIPKKSYKHIRLAIYKISRDLNFTMEHTKECK